MDRRLRELLTSGASRLGVDLDDVAVSRFSTYLMLLQRWGRKINLTTLLTGEEIVVHHFLDALAGVAILAASPHDRLVDLGAGAGFPSLPLKFALPALQPLLIESVRKKVSFCREVIRSVAVDNVQVVWGRAEDLGSRPEFSHRFDWAASRALGRSGDVAKMALPFLAPEGRIMIYKGEPKADELQELDAFCDREGMIWRAHPVAVPFLAGSRCLIEIAPQSRASASQKIP